MLNKKGVGVDDMVPLVIALLFFGAVLATFLILGEVKEIGTENDVEDAKISLEVINGANSFLIKEVEFDNQEWIMLDLIATIDEDEDEKISFIKSEAKSFLGEKNHWRMGLVEDEDNEIWAIGHETSSLKRSNVDNGCWETNWAGQYDIKLLHDRKIVVCY